MIKKEWSTNEVGLCWLKEKFTSWAKGSLRNTYCAIIIDGHGSHVSLKVIQHCTQNQIVAPCLPLHTSYIFQPLDVGIFDSLANVYKLIIDKKYR